MYRHMYLLTPLPSPFDDELISVLALKALQVVYDCWKFDNLVQRMSYELFH